jgi:nucleoside-diphosphate-sugar epimerase
VLVRGRAPGIGELECHARSGRLRLLVGDLTRGDLGLSRAEARELTRNVTTVVHAAAYYRLSGDRETMHRVNVAGLGHLLVHAAEWPLTAFHHVSSITVAGAVEGQVAEAPLPRPRRFRNWYEESKWTAESMLLEWAQVPLRIYRPGIVIGSSLDGAAQKFDGPYEAFGLMRQFLPFVVPGSGDFAFPLVTVDLVADVIGRGAEADPPRGGPDVLHVLDLDPPTLREFSREMTRRLAGHAWVLSLPAWLVLLVSRLQGFERLTGLQAEAVEYMQSTATFSVEAFRRFCERNDIRARRVKGAYDPLALYYATAVGRQTWGVA